MTTASVSNSAPRLRVRGVLTVVGLGLAIIAAPVVALDPGEDGVIVTIPISGISDTAQAVALNPGGDLVLVGSAGGNYSALARVTAAGTLDGGFGTLGVSKPDFSSSTGGDGLRAFVRMDDGRYVGCGLSHRPTTAIDFLLAVFNSNGSLDSTFNGGGYAVTAFTPSGSGEQCNAVALQTDGMIVSA